MSESQEQQEAGPVVLETSAEEQAQKERQMQVAAIHQSIMQGRFAEAERLCAALDQDDDVSQQALFLSASIAFCRGQAVIAEGYRDAAIANLEDRVARYPNEVNANLNLSQLLLSKGLEKEAESYLQRTDLGLASQDEAQEVFFSRFQDSIARGLPLLPVIGAPYAGAEGVAGFLTQGLGMASVPLALGLFPHSVPVPSRLAAAAQGGIVAPMLMNPSELVLRTLGMCGVRKLVIVARDPRAVSVSWAQAVLVDQSMRIAGPLNQKIYPPMSVLRKGMPATVDWCTEHFLPLVCEHLLAWRAAGKTGLQLHWLRLEDTPKDPEGEVLKILDFFDIDRALFDKGAANLPKPAPASATQTWRVGYRPDQMATATAVMPDELFKVFEWKR